jgi:peptide-methionine (S)-S-oxide reductase/peptide methionine sulfoxide reductase msrA/msrB
MSKLQGVVSTTVGYTGGTVENPTYEDVCRGDTGHVEAVEVEYDPEKIGYEELAKMFFETHDPTQKDGQGPDIGSQYQSKIFYSNEEEKEIAEKLVQILRDKGMDIATKIEKLRTFYPAEDYHQDYYKKNGGIPYCHTYRQLF